MIMHASLSLKILNACASGRQVGDGKKRAPEEQPRSPATLGGKVLAQPSGLTLKTSQCPVVIRVNQLTFNSWDEGP